MAYYKDLREFVALLEDSGKLYGFRDPIKKDTGPAPATSSSA